MKWWPIIIRSPAEADMISAQLHTKRQDKAALQDRIDIVALYPPGRLVHISGGTTMSQADWQAQASAEMAIIDAHITKLESY